MTVQSFRDLIAWQKSIDLVADIYEATKTFPKDEVYALTNQLRRAAVSVPSNIAEGQRRFSTSEFRYFLGNARGSLFEVQTQLVICSEAGLLASAESRRAS
jgi:four helix bundle protein